MKKFRVEGSIFDLTPKGNGADSTFGVKLEGTDSAELLNMIKATADGRKFQLTVWTNETMTSIITHHGENNIETFAF